MKKSLLILGGVLPAVQLLRRIHRYVDNVHIIAQNTDVIVYSKYGEKFIYKRPEECIEVIEEWLSTDTRKIQQWLVIPCSEYFVQYTDVFRNKGYEVFASSSSDLNIFYDKKKFYTWLQSVKIPTADFYQIDENLEFSNDEQYIIKCAKASDKFSPPFKTKIISRNSDLQKIREIIPKFFWNDFVIQRLFRNNRSISYGGVWIHGEEVASIIATQVRQYPQGITSHAVKTTQLIDINLINDTVSKISENIQLHGFIELEFIKNDSGMYPIDLNPRLWGWSNFLFHNFPEIPSIVMKGEFEEVPKNKNLEGWANIWRDVPAILNSRGTAISKIQSFLCMLRKSKKDFINWNDIKPEFSTIIKIIRKTGSSD